MLLFHNVLIFAHMDKAKVYIELTVGYFCVLTSSIYCYLELHF